MDNFITPAENGAEVLQKLEGVLTTASEFSLELNLRKCHSLQREIDFLDIWKVQLQPSPLKTKAVQKFPEPKSVKHVQPCVGLTSYLRKSIQDYSLIAKPLKDLLRNDTKYHFDDH